MKAPVLVVADAASARAIRAALADLEVTVTDEVTRAQALVSTGAFLVVFATRPFLASMQGAVEVDATHASSEISDAAQAALTRVMATRDAAARSDEIGALPYDEYVELARYAFTRRYLLALLGRHNGSVTDAAKGAKMKRESLHRLMRRYHVTADDFRER
jgi:transcriptional regulator with GAF, ATPase, and Fis domain